MAGEMPPSSSMGGAGSGHSFALVGGWEELLRASVSGVGKENLASATSQTPTPTPNELAQRRPGEGRRPHQSPVTVPERDFKTPEPPWMPTGFPSLHPVGQFTTRAS